MTTSVSEVRVLHELKRRVRSLPEAPGVYLFKDAREKIIYVGKAASLRKRVSSYFTSREGENPRLSQLRSRIEDVDFIVTSNEVEALILEANLIKRYYPDCNVKFRDDKSYPYMVICTGDTYPRVMFIRGQRCRDALYYGPFAHARAVRETIETLRKVFPFRACRGRKPGKGAGGPCLDYHIKLCSGPCIESITPGDYRKIIDGVREFMEGRHEKILVELEERMRAEASRQQFELAARTRDKLSALRRMLERQQAHSLKEADQDIFAVHRDELDACVTVFYVRGGKILGKKDFFTDLPMQKDESEIMAALLPQFYYRATYFPREVLLSNEIDGPERELLQKWLTEKSGRRIKILVPRKGEKRRMVEIVMENSRHALDVYLVKQASDLGWISRAVNGIYEGLRMDHVPYRIECYDISNLGSQDAVGSMVVYEGGIPARKDYRLFRIKRVKGPDDAAMIEEILDRRLVKLNSTPPVSRPKDEVREGVRLDSFHKRPDLILIDGGVPQLSAALKALRKGGFEDIGVAALAKNLEEIYLPGRRKAVYMPRDSEALHLLQRIRDEAHRYAIEYHRHQREKRTRHSALDDITGIGTKRKMYLMRHYGSIAGIAGASLEELQSLSFLDNRTAENVYRKFSPQDGGPAGTRASS